MRKYFPIYEEAVSHLWLCNCSTLNFPICEENFIFLFYQCRVLSFSFFSNRRNWDSPPTPQLQARVCLPPPFGWGWLAGGGLGSPNSDEGTYTVVLCIYKYFVPTTLSPSDLPLSCPSLLFSAQLSFTVSHTLASWSRIQRFLGRA